MKVSIKMPIKVADNNRRPPEYHTVCAVIVSYCPPETLSEHVTKLASQVDKIVIVDNGSSLGDIQTLIELSIHAQVHVIFNANNRGIAAALNQGLAFAVQSGYSWALILDQDSVCLPEMLKKLRSVYDEHPSRESIGIVGSNYRESKTGTTALYKQKLNNPCSWIEVKEVITSGSLLSLSVYEKIGSYREDFFMYYVDHEYCARIRLHGYKIVLVTDVLMLHSTGDAQIKKLLGFPYVIFNYPPEKMYYIVRNGLLLLAAYFFSDTRWAVNRLWVVLKRIALVVLLEENRVRKMRYSCLGLWHAITNKTGQLSCRLTGNRNNEKRRCV